jgi:hypothetical protein
MAPKKKLFTVSLAIGGEVYTAKADTVVAAVEQLTPGPLKGKGVITVFSGDKKSELMAYPIFLKRLFVNPTARLIFEKRMIAQLR